MDKNSIGICLFNYVSVYVHDRDHQMERRQRHQTVRENQKMAIV